MPMTWDAAADAKLFTAVMAVYDIKISGAQNQKIAEMMGDDVTAKAITHRLSKIKSLATSSTTSSPSTPKSTSRKIKSTGKGKSGLSATHTRTTVMHDDDDDDNEQDLDTTPSRGKKRKFKEEHPAFLKDEGEGEEVVFVKEEVVDEV